MTPLQRYIAEEIATDHAEGLLSRREALRRLGLLGMATPAAAALLAACAESAKQSPTPTASGSPTATGSASPTAAPPGTATALQATAVTLPGPEGRTLQAAWAAAAQPRGGVLVIHENKGLTDHIRSVTGRFAGAGYSALAVDLLSEEGGTATFTDPAAATAALSKIPQDRFVADLRAGLAELGKRVPGKKLGATGFCFGGGLTWLLLTSGTAELAAATPFTDPSPTAVRSPAPRPRCWRSTARSTAASTPRARPPRRPWTRRACRTRASSPTTPTTPSSTTPARATSPPRPPRRGGA